MKPIKTNQNLISHTGNSEFEKLKCDKAMESLKDRTIYVNIPKLLEDVPQLWGKFEQQVAYQYIEECVMYFNEISFFDGVLTDIEDAAKIPKEDRHAFRSEIIISLFCAMHKNKKVSFGEKTLWFFMENHINVPKQLRNAITLYMFQPLMKS